MKNGAASLVGNDHNGMEPGAESISVTLADFTLPIRADFLERRLGTACLIAAGMGCYQHLRESRNSIRMSRTGWIRMRRRRWCYSDLSSTSFKREAL